MDHLLQFREKHPVLKDSTNHSQDKTRDPTLKHLERSSSFASKPSTKSVTFDPALEENKKIGIISFKPSKKRTLSAKTLVSKFCSENKLDSPMHVQKKSRFCTLESESKTEALQFGKKSLIQGPNYMQSAPTTPEPNTRATFCNTKSSMMHLGEEHKNYQPSRQLFSYVRKLSCRSQSSESTKLDDFVKGRFLGKGIYGEVFLVRHKATNWTMAMKILNKQAISASEKLTNQLIQQIKIHCYSSHPNICSMYGFFSDSTNIYLLLEMCTDKSLYSQLKTHRCLGEEKTVGFVNQVADGLDYLHLQDIIHRDIKPENILLTYDVIKITDFGWAAHCINGMRNTVCGTPLYLSPQLILGEEYSKGADVWALGILTYELICGKNPFKIIDRNQLNRIVSDEIKFPAESEMSLEAQCFIKLCLEKNQEFRGSMGDLRSHAFLTPKVNPNASLLLQM